MLLLLLFALNICNRYSVWYIDQGEMYSVWYIDQGEMYSVWYMSNPSIHGQVWKTPGPGAECSCLWQRNGRPPWK